MPPGDPRFHLVVGSRFENVELVQSVLNEALERLGLGDEDRHWIDLAVREAVANAIKHGNRLDPRKRIEVGVEVVGGELVIQVIDEGEGFDPRRIQDPLAPENLLNPNGRGIFYMRSFMDVVDYSPRNGGGTVVTLRKRLAEGPEATCDTQ